MKKFIGTGVAIITPFKDDDSVDFNSLVNVINHVIKGGVDYIVALGTTGEASTLTQDEKHSVISHVRDVVDKRVPIVVGFGGNNTREVVNNIKEADLNGIAGVLSVAPYYNKPSQRGLFEHFRVISECSPVPVIIYNVPGRTSCNISSDTCLELAHECKNIVAIKEASGDMSQIMKIIKGKPEDFLVVSGDDMLTIPVIAAGGSGVISVLANAYPSVCSGIVNNALNNNFRSAREFHFRFIEAIELLFADGNPSGIKAFMSLLELCENKLRLPLVPVNKSVYTRIQKFVEDNR